MQGHRLSYKTSVSDDWKSRYLHTISKPKLPRNSNINFIHNEPRHIQQRISIFQTTSDKQDHAFDNILRLNWYPENIIDETKHHWNHEQDRQTSNTEWLYFKIPVISDRLDHKITKIIYREGMPLTNPTHQDKPLSEHHRAHMHQTKLSHLKHQPEPMKKRCASNPMQGT